MRTTAALLTVALACLASAADTPPDPNKSDSHVKVTAKAGKPDAQGRVEVSVTLDIDKDCSVYANPAGGPAKEPLPPTAVTVKKGEEAKVKDLKVDYPKGMERNDPLLGKYSVYEGKVEIKAAFTLAEGEKGPVTLRVDFLASNDKKRVCYMAAPVDLQVP
jgi:Disulphide bond corrector protein DsbC